MTIDRIDPTKDYSPDNCRWATPLQQGLNKRSTIWVDYNGVLMSASDVARSAGVPINKFIRELKLHGGDPHAAISFIRSGARHTKALVTGSTLRGRRIEALRRAGAIGPDANPQLGTKRNLGLVSLADELIEQQSLAPP